LNVDADKLRKLLHRKLDELIDVIIKCNKEKFFELKIKNVNGDVITKIEFSDKEKVG